MQTEHIYIQDLINAGAHLAASPREAVANADIIVSCLFDDKSCLDTAQGHKLERENSVEKMN